MKKADQAKVLKRKQGFSCLKCGYDAYKLAAFSHCPLCVICKGCAQKVSKCKCMESQ